MSIRAIVSTCRAFGVEVGARWVLRVGLVLSMSLGAFPVMAQSPPCDESAGEPEESSAQASVSTGARTSEHPAMQKARLHIDLGEQLFAECNYEAAIGEFTRAYELLDGHPQRYQALFNIALCEQKLFRYARAFGTFTRAWDEGGNSSVDASALRESIAALRQVLVVLEISSNTQVQVWVDDLLVGQAPGAVTIEGGRHTVEVRARGFEPVKRELRVAAGSRYPVDFTLTPIDTSDGIAPAWFWTGIATSVAATGVGVTLGVLARRKHDDAASEPLLADRNDQREIDNLALSADIAFGAAGILALTSGVLYFITDWGSEPDGSQLTVGFALDGDRTVGMLHGAF